MGDVRILGLSPSPLFPLRMMKLIYACLVAVLFTLGARAQDATPEFLQALADARRLGSEADIDRVIKGDPDQAMFHFTALCWNQKRDPNAETEASRQVMREAWIRIWRYADVLDQVQGFVDRLSPRAEQDLAQAGQALTECFEMFEEAKASRDREPYERARQQAFEIVEVFEAYSDNMSAAETWALAAQISDAIPEKNVSDRREVVSALRRFIELRSNWGWTEGAIYNQNLAFLQRETEGLGAAREESVQREAEGYAVDAVGMDRLVMPNAEEQILDLKFAMLREMEPDMYVKGGPVSMMWPSVALVGESPAPAELTLFKGSNLYLLRPKNNEYAVTTDGSFEPDPRRVIEVNASSRPRPTQFFLDDERTVPYAMWFYLGSDRETYMMAEINMAPTREMAEVFYRSAASWTTSIAGENVTFYDDNCDGLLFSTDAFEHGTRLRTLGAVTDEGIAVPAYDSMQVGRGPRVPFSSTVKIGETWYNLRETDEKWKVGVRELNPTYFKTGEVQLNWSGTRRITPQVLVIQSVGDLRSMAFDISSTKAVEVPVGEYQIGFGRIVVGRGGRTLMAHIFQGDSETFRVEEGETFELSMGGGFHIDFVREGSGRQLRIDSTKLRVLDESGAIYTNLHGGVLTPEVVASRREDGRGARAVGEFVPAVTTVDPIVSALSLLGRDALSIPRTEDAGGGGRRGRERPVPNVLTVQLDADGMFVGLQQLKHPLFGDLDPVFK